MVGNILKYVVGNILKYVVGNILKYVVVSIAETTYRYVGLHILQGHMNMWLDTF